VKAVETVWFCVCNEICVAFETAVWIRKVSRFCFDMILVSSFYPVMLDNFSLLSRDLCFASL